ncbi:carboxylesterase/lipase family protein [Streptomyces sp. NPDC048594]|uniref:carboxylesterase/lipase family protein n=1 Tax=Streptomyces sp. NPDC048594 TaxID=3365575 RepID=UPI003719C9E7
MVKKTARAALSLALAMGVAATAAVAGACGGGGERPVPESSVVRTDGGLVRGVSKGAVRVFEGMRYAAPPTGERRWAPPEPAESWAGVRDATVPGAACPQTGLIPPAGPRSDTEDCLFLNVTTPRGGSAEARPVMVYLHGGDHTDGEGAMHGADRLSAQGDVVVVTVNYRLGALGYLAHPTLERDGRGESGNYGFLDQQAALRWVRSNASAFGGDPENVTLFGQSAGASSTCAHLVAPSSAGLFDRVILQSGSCLGEEGVRTRPEALRDGRHSADGIGRTQDRDWRDARPAQLVKPFGQGPAYGPVYGGELLPRTPAEAFAAGDFNKVPVLQGFTGEEGRAGVYAAEEMKKAATGDPGARLDEADYLERLTEEFGEERAAEVAARYPVAARPGAPALALGDVLTDSGLGRLAIESNRALARQVRTYTYTFDDRETPWYADEEAYPKPSFPMGASHTFELPYLFELEEIAPLDEAQRALSEVMIRTWSRFARTGTTDWAPGTPASANARSFASGPGGVRSVDLAEEHRFGFWKSLPEARS